jgi:uncharacterized protein YaiL (DUF2058 family)
MAKNALQAQLLKAGLVDPKKANKINKQTQHAKRQGEASDAEVKQALQQAAQEKQQKDLALNQQRQRELEEKTLKANMVQMINQHKLTDTDGDITYQFIDQGKIKKLYVGQKIYDQLVAGHAAIANANNQYRILPRPLAEKINQRCEGFIVVLNQQADQQAVDEDDPYAAYVIPDDLMW